VLSHCANRRKSNKLSAFNHRGRRRATMGRKSTFISMFCQLASREYGPKAGAEAAKLKCQTDEWPRVSDLNREFCPKV